MVSARSVDERHLDLNRRAILGFVGDTCRARTLDPRKQLAIWISLNSITCQNVAADIAGVEWTVRHGRQSWLSDEVRTEGSGAGAQQTLLSGRS